MPEEQIPFRLEADDVFPEGCVAFWSTRKASATGLEPKAVESKLQH